MGIVGSAMSTLLYYGEKFTACAAVTALVTCLIATLVITLGLGVGLGYNYCFVDIKTKYKQVGARYKYPPTTTKKPLSESDSWSDTDSRIISSGDSSVDDDDSSPNIGLRRHSRQRGYRRRKGYPPFYYRRSGKGSKGFPGYDNYDYVPYAKGYPYKYRQRTLVKEATLPNLSNDNNPNKIASLSLHKTATFTNDTLINVANTTEVSRTKENMTTIESTTEKVDVDEGVQKMSIPISGLDLIGLLSRLRAENRNYSLQIVA